MYTQTSEDDNSKKRRTISCSLMRFCRASLGRESTMANGWYSMHSHAEDDGSTSLRFEYHRDQCGAPTLRV